MKVLRVLRSALAFVWFGAVGAISFMEAPLKFGAPNLTRPVALEVGYIVFHALNKVEWTLCILLGVTFIFLRPGKGAIAVYLALLTILILQTFWLFPVLDERTIAIINSRNVGESNFHLFYVVFEVIKVVLLFALGTLIVLFDQRTAAESRT